MSSLHPPNRIALATWNTPGVLAGVCFRKTSPSQPQTLQIISKFPNFNPTWNLEIRQCAKKHYSNLVAYVPTSSEQMYWHMFWVCVSVNSHYHPGIFFMYPINYLERRCCGKHNDKGPAPPNKLDMIEIANTDFQMGSPGWAFNRFKSYKGV